MKSMDQLIIKFEIISLGYDDYVILELCIWNKFWQQFRIENTTLDNWSESGGMTFLESLWKSGVVKMHGGTALIYIC